MFVAMHVHDNQCCCTCVQGVSTVATTHGHHNPQALPINLTTEAGSFGGVPVGGLRFGAGHNSAAHLPCASMIDFYNGGGVDVAILGMAEVSRFLSAPLLGCSMARLYQTLLFLLIATVTGCDGGR